MSVARLEALALTLAPRGVGLAHAPPAHREDAVFAALCEQMTNERGAQKHGEAEEREEEQPLGERDTLPAPFMPDPSALPFLRVVVTATIPAPSVLSLRTEGEDVGGEATLCASATDGSETGPGPTLVAPEGSVVGDEPATSNVGPAPVGVGLNGYAKPLQRERMEATHASTHASAEKPAAKPDRETISVACSERLPGRGTPEAAPALSPADSSLPTSRSIVRGDSGAPSTATTTTTTGTKKPNVPTRDDVRASSGPSSDHFGRGERGRHPVQVEGRGTAATAAEMSVSATVEEASSVIVSRPAAAEPRGVNRSDGPAETGLGLEARAKAVRLAEAASHRRMLLGNTAHGHVVVPELGRVEVRARLGACVDVHVTADEEHTRRILATNAPEILAHVEAEVPNVALHVERAGTELSDGGFASDDRGSNRPRDHQHDDDRRSRFAVAGGPRSASSDEKPTLAGRRARVRIVL